MTDTPYIVTTHRWLPSAEDDSGMDYEERVAVASLEEANREVAKITRVAGLCDFPPEGDSITFEDGTTIEVKPTTWARIYDNIDWTASATVARASGRSGRFADTALIAWNRKDGTAA